MSTIIENFEPLAVDVLFKGSDLSIILNDNRELLVPLQLFPRLMNANEEQRNKWRLIGEGMGIHWKEIDEDLPVEPLVRDSRTKILLKKINIYNIDIGKINEKEVNFAWARGKVDNYELIALHSSSNIKDLVDCIKNDLNDNIHTAIGFECPLFIPLRDDPLRLNEQREGEKGRPWSAGAGSQVLVIGISEILWILKNIKDGLKKDVQPFLNWDDFCRSHSGIFIWESFISFKKKITGEKKHDHIMDAEKGVRSFFQALPEPFEYNAIQEKKVHSLIGSALLRSGWSNDLTLLEKSTLTIKAS